MYSLTINFETKEELVAYLSDAPIKEAAVKTKAVKKTKAKPAKKAEVPVEEPKVNPAVALKEKQEAEKSDALARVKAFTDAKSDAHGFDAVIAMANATKEQLGVNPSTSVNQLATEQIKLFLQELSITMEDYELKKQKENKVI